jgi:RNA polymerase sigma-70 factor (ECF subfamily)
MDEMDLIKNAQRGNRLSMNMLLENNYKMLYGFLLKLIADEELAKDLTQDTMMKAVLNIKKFRGESKFSSWLIQIGINRYKNYAKKHKVQLEIIETDVVSGDNIEKQCEVNDQLRRINQYLKHVKPIDRMIFVLKYYEGYDYQEISHVTGTKIGTCKSKMHYLINKLKIELEVTV